MLLVLSLTAWRVSAFFWLSWVSKASVIHFGHAWRDVRSGSACSAQAGVLTDGTAARLYLACWKSDSAPCDAQSRLRLSKKCEPGKMVFWQLKCFGPARGQSNLWAVLFFPRSVAFIYSLLTPGGLWAALRGAREGNREVNSLLLFAAAFLVPFPRGLLLSLSWELPLFVARGAEESRRCSSGGGRCEGSETMREGAKANSLGD